MANILITGSNRGIGLEFVSQYLDRGDTVLATCRNPQGADRLQGLQTQDARLKILQLDVSQPQGFAGFAAGLQGQAIDVFINNAGVYGPRPAGFGDVREQDWLPVLLVNTLAPLLLTQSLIANFRQGTDRKLVYLTSKMGSIADNTSGASYIYRSSKAALNQVVKSLSADLAADRLTAVVVHPGWVQTDMGGPNALIDTQTSVSGMIAVIDGLSSADSGGFFNYDGNPIPW
jgi:NAD(P)-dependent dehydrogenase (short-subunit alcohol dehydrogenase family)